MLTKHIDVIALFVIAFALLVFAHAPDLRIVPTVRVASFRTQNDPSRNKLCPFSGAWIPRFH
jgi:hypothetical protein